MDISGAQTERAIEAALRRPWWRLKLPAELESAFEAETGAARCQRLINFGLVVLVLYDLYLLVDLRLVPDVFTTALVVRLGVVTPLALAIVVVLRSNPSPALRESLEAVITVIVTASILWLMIVSKAPLRIYHHYGIILVILFATVVQRIRFWYALSASLASLAIYAAVVANVSEIPPEGRLMTILVMANTVLFTLMATHALERDTRRVFLLGLRNRLRRNDLEQIAHRDPLTGLGNRRALDDDFNRIWAEAHERGESVALLMLDIDEFKAFNDRYGHLAGDTCLNA